MIDTPKTLQVPGIDIPLREQTLAEYVLAIPDKNHLVHRELAELQRRAFAWETDKVLLATAKAELAQAKAQVANLLAQREEALFRKTNQIAHQTRPNRKIPCPICHLPISPKPGPWTFHMIKRHKDIAKEGWPPYPNETHSYPEQLSTGGTATQNDPGRPSPPTGPLPTGTTSAPGPGYR